MKLIGFETVGGFCGFVALVLLVVVGLGRCCKRLLGVSGSASAFVFFNILFVWAVYLAVLRPGAFFFNTIKNSVIHALMSSHFRLKLLNIIECYYNFF